MNNKIKIVSFLFFLLITVCGCGKNENKMICTIEEEDGVIINKYILNYDSEWEEIDKLVVEEIIDFSSVKDIEEFGCGKDINECLLNAKEDYEVCKNNSMFSDCKIEDETKTGLKIVAEVADKELKNEDNVFYVNKNTSKSKAKDILKDKGYKCE